MLAFIIVIIIIIVLLREEKFSQREINSVKDKIADAYNNKLSPIDFEAKYGKKISIVQYMYLLDYYRKNMLTDDLVKYVLNDFEVAFS
jgi:hypothetical protein